MRTLINQYTGLQYYAFSLINAGGQFLEAFLTFYFINRIFSLRTQYHERLWIAASFLMTAVTICTDILSGNNPYAWTASLLFCPLLYTIICCRGNWKTKVVVCLLSSCVLLSLENLSVSLFYLLFSPKAVSYPALILLYASRRFLMKLCLFAVLRFLLHFTVKVDQYTQKTGWYFLGFTCAAEILIMFLIREYSLDMAMQFTLQLFFVFVPVVFYCMLNLVEDNMEKAKITILQQNLLHTQDQYMAQILQMQDSLRKFRHDYRSHLFCMDGLIQNKKYEELHSYLEQLHKYEPSSGTVTFTRHPTLNILLNQKKQIADKESITFDIKVTDFSFRNLSAYDFNIIIFNLCDNAIEAARRTSQKTISLTIGEVRGYIEIRLRNSVAENVLKKNPSLLTDKGDTEYHGYGMKIIRNLIEKYQGIMDIQSGDDQVEFYILLLNDEETEAGVNQGPSKKEEQ